MPIYQFNVSEQHEQQSDFLRFDFSHNIMLHCYNHTLLSGLLSFFYRYYILNRPAPKASTIRMIIFIVHVPSFIQLVSA
ncbi:unnamed protein product [Strongylus vulgaris]|uniref:Uncharacterized protein n=1 Tax=Strongylus vulgaris TaxID=40348 RepID=A0A3P7LGU3_STRVU|nr:unnamed protein product [Strongylus vulgaris]